MLTNEAWGDDLVAAPEGTRDIGLESYSGDLVQGKGETNPWPFFKPVNIVVDEGLYYANIYVCGAFDGTVVAQQLAIWLSSLKDTDYVHLTLSSLLLDVPLGGLIGLMSAFASTKAKIDIHLDQIVIDGLAYFYLLADKVTQGTEGALYIPSYVGNARDQDRSGPWKATNDFYGWVVDDAVEKGRLTAEEANRLHHGSHVIIPSDRFAKTEA